MSTVYENNLLALEKVNSELAQKIKNTDSNERFDVFQGDSSEAINILDNKTDDFLYVSPLEDILKQQISYRDYRDYEYLFIYGIGNGILVRELLKNQKLSKIILIESQIELLFIALNLTDFSDEISKTKIIILESTQLSVPFIVNLLNNERLKFYARAYTLLVQTPYYERNHKEDIKQTNNLFLEAYEHLIYTEGNDITDQFTGLKHTIINIPTMLKNPTLKELKSKKNSPIAVVVSTGPSLFKQLSTLKEYQDFITIISVDASLPILEKHGIKPDIVASIERVELTSKFFEETSDEFQKDIIFASVSLQHTKVLNAIKGTKVLIQRPFIYNNYFGFDEYGYIGNGMSAANLAHELAISMKYTDIILIGQDLAYGDDGTSHSKGHVLGEESDTQRLKDMWIELEAYKGEGKVKSTKIWKLFKNFFEQVIHVTSHSINTYNCTEGGARIEGTIEKSFSTTLEKFIDKTSSKKELITLKAPSKKVFESNLKIAKEKLTTIVEEGEVLQDKINTVFLSIETFAKKYEDIDLKKALKTTKDHKIIKKLNEIEDIRKTLETNKLFTEFFHDIAKPYLLHYELDLTLIKVKVVDDAKDNKEKALKWILSHRYWLFSLSGIIHNIVNATKEELEKRDI